MSVIQKESIPPPSRFTRNTLLSTKANKRRLDALPRLVPATKAELGQFMTAAPIAEFMASLFTDVSRHEVHLLDPGAGVGSLAAAFVQRTCAEPKPPKRITITAYEIDPNLADPLRLTLDDCVRVSNSAGIQLTYKLLPHDFIQHATRALEGGLFAERPVFTHVITNPPYKKISSKSQHRKLLRRVGIEVTNLYAAFVSLAVKLLSTDGEIVAITPRSFCNGPYFLPFRRLLLSDTTIRQIHVFEARDIAFRDDNVLQENIIYHAIRAPKSLFVKLSSSHSSDFQNIDSRCVHFSEIVHHDDSKLVIHLPISKDDAQIVRQIRTLTHSLADLDIAVSTGPVVDFRLRTYIHKDSIPSTVPLIYPAHFQKGSVIWPKVNGRKPNSIDDTSATRKWLMPKGCYTLTRRFSSKEEKRRIVAAVFNPDHMDSDWIGFENHLNVFHAQGHGLPLLLARGLALYLNSTIVDKFFRMFNGHTQVNATDLRALLYPSRETLMALGRKSATNDLLPQVVIDELVRNIVFEQQG